MRRILAEEKEESLENQLKKLASDLISDLAELEPAQSKTLLSDFVSELFLAQAQTNQQRERRQRQAAGIAEAKARGVRFGRPNAALPENFEELRQAWRGGELSVREAAQACGLSKSSFYHAAVSREQDAL